MRSVERARRFRQKSRARHKKRPIHQGRVCADGGRRRGGSGAGAGGVLKCALSKATESQREFLLRCSVSN
ncbi:hypothetical protein EVAR_22988_1 [Eumeta japonica]|uniref:Uncharacterized protein n=1 Tax=Eumeta variegata TaxID=151549 RepID=A0A4C1URR6_EUMVA|nr:hypothetical protein EVAR_22988_1 [Eumeta japonica]